MSVRSRGAHRARRVAGGSLRVLIAALVVAAFGAIAGAADAAQVRIVTQGEPLAGKPPPKVHYYKTIQAAVDATGHGDWVLVEPGVYYEEVKVTREHRTTSTSKT
jgi:pectin methylesterase-like acyl-CoA thioesterase